MKENFETFFPFTNKHYGKISEFLLSSSFPLRTPIIRTILLTSELFAKVVVSNFKRLQ